MNTAPENIDDLIASYLADEATPADRAFIDEWKAESAQNLRYFDQLRLIFEKAAAKAVKQGGERFDADVAWQKIQAKLQANEKEKTITLRSPNHPYHLFLRIAAGVIVILGVGFFGYRIFRPATVNTFQTQDATAADTLPDGSDIFLNRQTKIEYTTERDVHIAKLSGEAYFSIQHEDEKTFIVEAEETFIKDIGTSFNVKAYPGSPVIEVVVDEGEVIFYTKDRPGISVKANEKGIYRKDTRTFMVSEPQANVTAYRSKRFIFNNNALGTVVETLNSVYSTEIQIDDHLSSCRLTVTFEDETIDEIADIIAETLGLTVSRDANVITLKGPACGKAQP